MAADSGRVALSSRYAGCRVKKKSVDVHASGVWPNYTCRVRNCPNATFVSRPMESDAPFPSPSARPVPADAASVGNKFSLLEVSGSDAGGFLHGQFTNDVSGLESGRWTWSGYCSPKGRLLAVFRLARLEDRFLIQIPSSLADDFSRRLRRFVLRAKVLIRAPDPAVRCIEGSISASGRAALALPPRAGPGCVVVVPEGIVLVLDEHRILSLQAPTGGQATRGEESPDWSLDIDRGLPWILPPTQDAFTPHMVDLVRLGGVSFTKGCYPGQEIVARSEHLGGVRRHLYRLRFEATEPPEPGTSLLVPEGGDVAGTVLLGAAGPGGEACCLAVVDSSAAAAGPLRLATNRTLASNVDRVYPGG